MKRFSIYKGTFSLDLAGDGAALQLQVGANDEIVAEFPLQISLLRAVLAGMSYQVASHQGSLNISLNEQIVTLAIQRRAGEKFHAKIKEAEFASGIAFLSGE